MEFDYSEAKRQQIIKERKVDLLCAAGIFEGTTLLRPDNRADYGEQRFIATGLVANECFVVVYTERGDKIRLITAWKGGRRERSGYQNYLSLRAETD